MMLITQFLIILEITYLLFIINIRSLAKKFDAFVQLLNDCRQKFSIIALSETWLHSESPINLFEIPGYTFVHKNRISGAGGGVAIYINNDLKFSIVNTNENSFESLFLKVDISAKKFALVGVIYKPPTFSIVNFNSDLARLLTSFRNLSNDLYILGDFNINLLERDTNMHVSNVYNTLSSFSLLPCIDKPTRITQNTATLIDNILISNLNESYTCGILVTDISDHLPVFIICSTLLDGNKQSPKLLKRDTSVENIAKLRVYLKELNWGCIYNPDVNATYDAFIDVFSNAFNLCCPLKQMPILRRKKMLLGLQKQYLNLLILRKSCIKRLLQVKQICQE